MLEASRASRLAEFHDDASLWPSDSRRTVFLPREPGKLSNALKASGLAVTACPVQQRRVTVEAIEPGGADWSVVTSTRTVTTMVELGARLPGRIAAVGKATATTLEQAGYAVDLLPRVESAEGLLAEFSPGPGRVFLPCSALAPDTLADGLRRCGWEVARADVYTMEPTAIPTGVAARWQDGEYAAVVVTSGSVARVLDGALGWPRGTRVLAIGQATARVLNELGVAASVSPSPRPEAVAASVAELVRKGNA
ncbi:MAG: uroporphyrinogen-III synthase [Propionibacteriaceae bacterium]|nr:uroporphyrinogen-III synthase [Propionibacteriaceae bacterium]